MAGGQGQTCLRGPSAPWWKMRNRTCPGWTCPQAQRRQTGLCSPALNTLCTALPSLESLFKLFLPPACPSYLQVLAILGAQCNCHLLWEVCPHATSWKDLSFCLGLCCGISHGLLRVPVTVALSLFRTMMFPPRKHQSLQSGESIKPILLTGHGAYPEPQPPACTGTGT